MRDSMLIYRSFYEAGKALKNTDRLKLYDAIFEYGMDFKEPDLQGVVKTIFSLIKPNIDANIKKYRNGCEPKTKQDISKAEANNKQTISKHEGNEDDNVNEDDNENVNVKGTVKKFTPPSLDEVTIYCKEKGYNTTLAAKIFEYYETANWHDAKGQKVRNWKQKIQGVWFKDNDSYKLSEEKKESTFVEDGFEVQKGYRSTWQP